MKRSGLLESINLRSVFFYLTGRCNLKCRYCYFRHKGKNEDIDMGFADAFLKTLRQHPDRGKIRFVLSGGEPLLVWPLLEKTVQGIRRYFGSNPINVQTNATLLDARKLYFLRDQQAGLEIGIDGSFLSTGRQRLGISEVVFDRIGECIVCARKLGLSVSATMTVCPSEVSALLRNYFYLSSLGLKNIDITPAAFAGWNARNTLFFKTMYAKLLTCFDDRLRVTILTAEDVPQRCLAWGLSVEGNGVVLPGDVFLCLRPSVKRRFSLMRYQDGRLLDDPKNFQFFMKHFRRLASKMGNKGFSARDYVILSFLVLKEITLESRRRGCSAMAGLLHFLKETHQKYVLK